MSNRPMQMLMTDLSWNYAGSNEDASIAVFPSRDLFVIISTTPLVLLFPKISQMLRAWLAIAETYVEMS
jgi:hypothetical protein